MGPGNTRSVIRNVRILPEFCKSLDLQVVLIAMNKGIYPILAGCVVVGVLLGMFNTAAIKHSNEAKAKSKVETSKIKIVQASFETSPVEDAQNVIRNYLIPNGISPSAIEITGRTGKVTVSSIDDTVEWSVTEEGNPEYYKRYQGGALMHDLRYSYISNSETGEELDSVLYQGAGHEQVLLGEVVKDFS